jgi:hypothetical protein
MKREGRYKDCVPTGRRQADEIIRLKEAGVRPLEIASGLGSGGRAAGIEQHGTGNGQASVGGVKPTLIGYRAFGSSGVPQLLGSRLIDMP